MSSKPNQVFAGKTAIITGGASGIGRALAEELAGCGCDVTLADLQVELAQEVVSGIRAAGGKAEAYRVDVCDFSALETIVKETYARTGRLDYMFNNAGIAIGGDVHILTIEDWNRTIDINLRGVVNGIQAVYHIMIAQGFGHIINTASIAGLMPMPALAAYSATKHAVVGLSETLRIEAAGLGIRVSVVCPGVVRTPILDRGGKFGKVPDNIPSQMLDRIIEKMRPMAADIFARKVLKKVAGNRAIIIIPWWWRLFWQLTRLSPSLGIYLATQFYQRTKKRLEKAGK